MNKETRLNAIRNIITNHKIRSQEELLTRLTDLGYELTQATLSRDLKQLKVGRIPSKEGFSYVISEDIINTNNSEKFSPIAYGFLAIEFSGNIVVIKTLPAYSHTIADAIDKAEMNEVLGTVAGNDTVFAVVREGLNPDQIKKAFVKAIPELYERLKDDK
jgi:transcriptional regulator of arginine metabolism